MTADTCTPPAGTLPGTWHWLARGPFKMVAEWVLDLEGVGVWRYTKPHGGSCSSRPRMMVGEYGVSYVGAVEPTSTEAPGWDVCRAVAPEPKPPPGDKALLRDVLEFLGNWDGEITTRALRYYAVADINDLERKICRALGEY